MRKDMFKVIVERPRRGGNRADEAPAGAPDEDSPARESLRQRHRNRKWLNENLRPLERWLGSQVGRPWAKVYSELCEGIDRRSTVQQHIHQHVGDFVAVRVVIFDGRACDADRWSKPALDTYWAAKYFVDPVTGLLRLNKGRIRARRAYDRERQEGWDGVPVNRRDLSPWRQLHRIDGIWYDVDLAPLVSADAARHPLFDAVRNLPVWAAGRYAKPRGMVASDEALYGRRDVYAWRKRQLSGKELKDRGLANRVE